MDAPTATQATPKTQVFLSYSRKDADFCVRLAAALEARGCTPIFDQSDRPHDDPDLRLTAQDEWWTSLKAMIAASDVMVFIVSPDSAASPVCDDEIAHARALGKRVIAILRRTVDFNILPERLRALNVKIEFRDDAELAFAVALDTLCAELELDIEWHRIGARLMRQADLWERSSRPEAQLLRAGAIADADAWAARRPKDVSEPGALLLAFLDASRAYERDQRNRQRRIIGRAFVKPAEQAMTDGRYDVAVRLVAAGAVLAADPDFSNVPELVRAAARAALESSLRAVLHHKASIRSVAFSPDGTRVITAAADGTARIWDAATGAEVIRLAHDGEVRSAAFSSDGTRVVTASVDRTARVWDAASGAEIARMQGHEDSLSGAAFSPDGKRVITASQDKSARVWDATTGAEIARLQGHGWVSYASFSADGDRIITACVNCVRVWNAVTEDEAACISHVESELTSGALSPDGARVVTGSVDGTARVWAVKTGTEIARVHGHQYAARSATFCPDGTRVLTVSEDKTARIWDAANGAEISRMQGHEDGLTGANFSRDGTLVVTASRDRTARIWDAATGAEIGRLQGHEGPLLHAVFSPNGDTVVTASTDNTVRIWGAAKSGEIARFYYQEIYSAAFSPDGARVLAVSDVAAVWDIETRQKTLISIRGDDVPISLAAFCSDGARVVTASLDRTARVWDAASGAEIARMQGHEDSLSGAAFSPDGTRVITAAADGTARIWDAATGAEVIRLAHDGEVRSAAFSSDGTRVVTASVDRTARVWDAASGAEIARMQGHEDSLSGAAFSPDGKRVITASQDKSARVWDATTGAEIARLQGHSAVFSPGGGQVVTEFERYCLVYNARTGAEIARIKGHRPVLSSDGTRVVTIVGTTARIWDVATGAEVAQINCAGLPLLSAAFSPDGTRLVTASSRNVVRVWDIAATNSLQFGLGVVIAAALRGGIELRTPAESVDLLMQDAPDDLHAAYRALLPGRDADVAAATAILNARRHSNCYLSPTQLAEKFGLEPPPRVPFESFMTEADPPEEEQDTRAEVVSEALVAAGERAVPTNPPAEREPAIPDPPPPAKPRRGLGPGDALALSLAMLALGAAATFALVRLGLLPLE